MAATQQSGKAGGDDGDPSRMVARARVRIMTANGMTACLCCRGARLLPVDPLSRSLVSFFFYSDLDEEVSLGDAVIFERGNFGNRPQERPKSHVRRPWPRSLPLSSGRGNCIAPWRRGF